MIDLTLLDKNKTNAIVIRHSDRDKMDIGQTEQPLNTEGIINAEKLGTELRGFADYAFYSSPVDRCQQTVEYIQRGIFQGSEKKQNTLSCLLGKPGVFVIDRKNNAFLTLSCREVVVKQLSHEKQYGIRDTVEGAKLLIDYIVGEMEKATDGCLLVFVTHDAIVAPVIFELTGEMFGYENWPEFSDGFIIEQNTDGYKVIRKKKYYELKKF